MLHDLKIEDDKILLSHSRLCESINKNLKPLWELAYKCLQLRASRPSSEETEDEVNFLLRDEMKLSERTSRYFDHIVSNMENQHRYSNPQTDVLLGGLDRPLSTEHFHHHFAAFWLKLLPYNFY